jgi:hypothetical protein
VYKGFFENNTTYKLGMIKCADKFYYLGQVNEQIQIVDYGMLYDLTTQNLIYSGKFENNKYHGLGILYQDSFIYSGEFKDGLKHGRGFF